MFIQRGEFSLRSEPHKRETNLSLPPTPTQGEGKQLPPEPMLVKFSTQHRTNISGEPEGIWHQNQVEKGEIAGVTEPRFGGDGLG